jgi:hypothetical protein
VARAEMASREMGLIVGEGSTYWQLVWSVCIAAAYDGKACK